MNTPPLLLGVAVLFWGWQSGQLFAAVLISVLLECPRVVKARWHFSDEDFSRLWLLCIVLFVGAATYAFVAHDGGGAVGSFMGASSLAARSNAMGRGTRALLVFIQWLPLVFLPIVAAQAFSQRERIDAAVFSALVRRWRKTQAGIQPVTGVNVAFPFFSICLTGAAAANVRGPGFFAGLSLLVCWAIWPERSRRYRGVVWLSLALSVVGLGFLGALGVQRLQRLVENLHADWVTGLLGSRGRDRRESVTSIGKTGRLQLSSQIIMRVDATNPPPLLRNASFDLFRSPVWGASRRSHGQVASDADTTTWRLLPGKAVSNEVTVHVSLMKDADQLSLPVGTAELFDLPVGEVHTNRLGGVTVTEAPGLVSFQARYGPGRTVDGAPEELDTRVPAGEEPAVAKIATELQLSGLKDAEKIHTVARFFSEHFHYTQDLKPDPSAPPRESPLATFLLRQRAGHCEYFGTATVLLLRKAGVPARYATGYSVQEPDRLRGHGYVVRGRHAHAWCLAYVNGEWVDVDTTPGVWRSGESQRSSWWEPLSDRLSRMWFEFSRWRMEQSRLRTYLGWVVVIAVGVIAFRLIQKRQWSRIKGTGAGATAISPRLGDDSEFFAVERWLANRGHRRGRGESHSAWLGRLERAGLDTAALRAMLDLHLRHRFDPAGLDPVKRADLRARATEWFAAQAAASAPSAAPDIER